MVEARCTKCGNAATGATYEEAEENIECGLKLIRPGPCKEHILKRTCDGCPAYKVVQVAGTKESYDMVGKKFPEVKSQGNGNKKPQGKEKIPSEQSSE